LSISMRPPDFRRNMLTPDDDKMPSRYARRGGKKQDGEQSRHCLRMSLYSGGFGRVPLGSRSEWRRKRATYVTSIVIQIDWITGKKQVETMARSGT
ncbi:hypothetical protein, partial [Mesorhizobium mediterraneum]|uniref:hypothetical protein n=1 Tax=Mesorhizobium mediterraneum TaxID=43617 RepID=UPI001AEE01DD